MAVLAFVGFGELGASLAEGLSRSGKHVLRAYVRRRSNLKPVTLRHLSATGTEPCASLSAALWDADAVLAVVPGSSATEVAVDAAAHLRRGALYVDLTSCAPEEKRASAQRVSDAGASYVDAAVLGSVAVSGFEVPILASGSDAHAFRELVADDGIKVTAIDSPAGHAALVKLLRGIYLKGRDALIVEMLLAARRHDLDELVVASIEGPGEGVPFAALAERVLRSVAVHAGRRADELAAASELVRRAGVDPALTRAGSETLRRIAALGLRERFGGERPTDAGAVLTAIDELDRTSALAGQRT